MAQIIYSQLVTTGKNGGLNDGHAGGARKDRRWYTEGHAREEILRMEFCRVFSRGPNVALINGHSALLVGSCWSLSHGSGGRRLAIHTPTLLYSA